MLSSSQKLYTVDLLDRYRKALETAVQISCRFNLPPLPGRTVIVLSNNMSTYAKPKYDFCLPPDPEQKNEEEEDNNNEDGECKEHPSRRRKETVDEKLTPSVRACFFVFLYNCHYHWMYGLFDFMLMCPYFNIFSDEGGGSFALSDDCQQCRGLSALVNWLGSLRRNQAEVWCSFG